MAKADAKLRINREYRKIVQTTLPILTPIHNFNDSLVSQSVGVVKKTVFSRQVAANRKK